MEANKKTLIKITTWYIVGSVPFAFLMSTWDDYIKIIINFITLTVGLFIGILLRNYFMKRPWLILFVPILYLILGILGI